MNQRRPSAPGNPLFDRLLAAGAAESLAIETAERRFTYADIERQTARFAAALAALGVRAGDRIAALPEKSAENLIAYLAAIRAGAVWLPLNPAYTASEIAYFVADAEPALILCEPGRLDEIAAIAGPAAVASLEALAASADSLFETVGRSPSDLAAICYTSGTTGRPKGAMLTHANLISNAAALKELWRFTADDRLIHALPLNHVHGLFVATHVAMMAGASMILLPRFEQAAVIGAFARATSLMGVPTFYTRLLASPALTARAAAPMRLFVSGSAPLSAATHAAWKERTGQAILERYGMTETGMIASNPYEAERVAGAVGFPVPGAGVRIASAGAGEAGVIEVKGPGVFAGYWRAPEKTAAQMRDGGWFSTGDLGRIDRAGYLWIVGRAADLIISGGLNIYPSEVEAAIDALPGVVESAVIGVPHADLGEAALAVVVAAPEVREADILAGLQGRLARYKTPRKVVLASELPRNAMGKVEKAALRARHGAPREAAGPCLREGAQTST